MSVSRAQLIDLFVGGGCPIEAFVGPYPRFSVSDLRIETCSDDYVLQAYSDCLDMLPQECVEVRDLGNGRSRRVMRHTMRDGDLSNEAGDCDDHGHVLMAHAIIGNWKKAIRTKTSRGGGPLGVLDYVAIPKPGDRRAGGHDRNWFVRHDLVLRFFEPGDGEFATMLPEELASLLYGRVA